MSIGLLFGCLFCSWQLGWVGCAPALAQLPNRPADTVAVRYSLPQADCALFPATAALPSQMLRETRLSGRFTPTHRQVRQTERSLRHSSLAPVNAQEESGYYAAYPSTIQRQLATYQRQYFGFYNQEGHPCLWINFFIETIEEPADAVPRWLRTPVFFYDGGASLWSIYYDLRRQQFYGFTHSTEG